VGIKMNKATAIRTMGMKATSFAKNSISINAMNLATIMLNYSIFRMTL
jgi:hypothetical protein